MPLLVENVLQLVLYRHVPDGAQHFHAIVDIAGHQVRRPKQILWLSPVMEHIHSGVFKVSIDNADGFDIVNSKAYGSRERRVMAATCDGSWPLTGVP